MQPTLCPFGGAALSLIAMLWFASNPATAAGDAPLAGTKGRIFPSDHFGLKAVLRRRGPSEPVVNNVPK